MKSIVVTGASTGIGRACAEVLVARGFRVFGSVRHPSAGSELSAALGPGFEPLVFDVTDSTAVRAGAAIVQSALAGEPLFGLVNNAGMAVAGPLLFIEAQEFRQQLEVNVTGQLIATQAFAPLLTPTHASRGGRIVMMSSVGGRNASPFIGPYSASKFALEGLSESLRRELMLLEIDVIVVAPGAVATPIWDKAERMDLSRYAGTPYATDLATVRDYMLTHGREGLPARQIGETVWRALTVRNPKTRYVVTPDPLQNFLATHLPKRMVDRMIARRLGLVRKS